MGVSVGLGCVNLRRYDWRFFGDVPSMIFVGSVLLAVTVDDDG